MATAFDPNANAAVYALAVTASRIYVGGMFFNIGGSERDGIAALAVGTGIPLGWNPSALGTVNALAVSGNTVYAGGDFSSIGGQTRSKIAALDAISGNSTAWVANADNFPVDCLALSGTTVFAGGEFTTIGNFPQSFLAAIGTDIVGVPTPTREDGLTLLRQNDPNPFRSATLIRFTLGEAENVTLKVYDIEGRERTTLVGNERLAPGPHQVEFRPRGFEDGVYLCRLRAGRTDETKKMVIAR